MRHSQAKDRIDARIMALIDIDAPHRIFDLALKLSEENELSEGGLLLLGQEISKTHKTHVNTSMVMKRLLETLGEQMTRAELSDRVVKSLKTAMQARKAHGASERSLETCARNLRLETLRILKIRNPKLTATFTPRGKRRSTRLAKETAARLASAHPTKDAIVNISLSKTEIDMLAMALNT